MTTKQTIIAILVATIVQFIAEAAWFLGFAGKLVQNEMSCIMRTNPYIPLNFASELMLSTLIVLTVRFFPASISVKNSLLIGLVIGALVSMNQQLDWFANWTMSPLLFLLENIKNILLGVLVGSIAGLIGRRRKVVTARAISIPV